MISKKFTFLNVGNQATFLGNIKQCMESAGAEYAWTIDRYTPGDDGELLAHSTGAFGNQNLYYSIKLRHPNNNVSHIHLTGQTGYDSGADYNKQPGKFTLNLHTSGLDVLAPSWDGAGNNYSGNYLRAPVEKQVIFVNKQFIMVFWKQEVSLLSPPGTTYPLWCRFLIGAMDGLFPETETLLNWVDEVTWGRYGWTSSMFVGGHKHLPVWNGSNWPNRPYCTTGLLWKQPYDETPVNKEIYWGWESWSNPMRWMSTINHYDNTHHHAYSGGTHMFAGRDVGAWRMGGSYTDGTRYNVSVVKHFLHRPVVMLYEWKDAENIFFHPIAYLPYQAVRMGNVLKGDDTIAYGTRKFSVYPDCRDGVAFGCAIEYIQG